jgi:hypothetical protein
MSGYAITRELAGCTTRLPAEAGWTAVIACDALSADADPGAIDVGVSGGALGDPLVAGGATVGRVHLLLPIVERAGTTVDVTVTTGEAWSCAGVTAAPADADGWRQAFADEPWRSLFDPPAPIRPRRGGARRRTRGGAARRPTATVSFSANTTEATKEAGDG